jgi:hypothetical protein
LERPNKVSQLSSRTWSMVEQGYNWEMVLCPALKYLSSSEVKSEGPINSVYSLIHPALTTLKAKKLTNRT